MVEDSPAAFGPEQRRQGLVKVAGGNAFEVKPGQQLLDGFGLAQIGRQDAEVKRILSSPSPRSRTRGTLTGTAPIPVITSRSGR